MAGTECDWELFGLSLRPIGVITVHVMSPLLGALLLLGLAACTDTDKASTPPAKQEGSWTAAEICRASAGDAEVLGAWSTTVGEVRRHTGGPPPGQSPAAKPWADLPGGATAAWCTLNRDGVYAVSAATIGGPLVDFMVTREPPGEFANGPAIP
jgi:hypothetical protein